MVSVRFTPLNDFLKKAPGIKIPGALCRFGLFYKTDYFFIVVSADFEVIQSRRHFGHADAEIFVTVGVISLIDCLSRVVPKGELKLLTFAAAKPYVHVISHGYRVQ